MFSFCTNTHFLSSDSNPRSRLIHVLKADDFSLGEYAALATSGALSIETTLRVVALRAQSMVRECVPAESGMLACELSPDKAEEMLLGAVEFSELNVACRNSNKNCVVAGPLDQLKSFAQLCEGQKIKAKFLDVPYAFHSQAMDPIVRTLEEIGKSVKWSRPGIDVLSGVSGRWLDEDVCNSSFFARHARQPVLFMECIDALMSKGLSAEAIFVEIGPHPITLPMIRSQPVITSQPCLASLRKGQPAWTSLSSLLSSLHTLIDNIEWREVFVGSDAKMAELPGYPLQFTRFEMRYQEDPTENLHKQQQSIEWEETGYRLLPKAVARERDMDTLILEADGGCLGPLIMGHQVGGAALCPASVFHEIALEAGRILLDVHNTQVIAVEDLTFQNPLIYDPSEECAVRIVLTRDDTPAMARFEILSGKVHEGRATPCCSGALVSKNRVDLETQWKRHSATAKRYNARLKEGSNSHVSTFQTEILYDHVFPRVVQYSKIYQSISVLNISDNLEGIGTFHIPCGSEIDGYVVPPSFTDTLLHAAGFIANVHVPVDTVCICTAVQSIEVLYDEFNYDRPFTVYCTLYEADQNSIVADAYGIDSLGRTLTVIYGMQFKRLQLASFRRHLQANLTNTSPAPSVSRTPPNQQSTTALATRKDHFTPQVNNLLTSKQEVDSPSQNVKETFRDIVANVCGIAKDAIDTSKSLESLGIDSLLQIEMTKKLAEAFPAANLDQDRLAGCDTLLVMEDEINAALGVPTDGSQSPANAGSVRDSALPSSSASTISLHDTSPQPVAIPIQQSDNKAPPLYLFHDGSGQVSMYYRVENLERKVFAIPSPRLSNPDQKHVSLRDLATDYVSSLSNLPRDQPVILAGWSFGGVVAFEAARLLRDAGRPVQGLILIDAPFPVDHVPLPQALITHLFGKRRPGAASSKDAFVVDQFQYHARLLSEHRATPCMDDGEGGRGIRTVILYSENTLDTERLCGVPYEWLNSEKVQKDVVQGWKTLVGEPVGSLSIPGNHFEAFDRGNVSLFFTSSPPFFFNPFYAFFFRDACILYEVTFCLVGAECR